MSQNGHSSNSHNGHIDLETRAELERLARSRPRSGRGQAAKLGALRTLERLQRKQGPVNAPPVPDGWHPLPGSAWEELDRRDSPELRQAWWERLYFL
jgi:hypothetical protein